MGDSGSRVVTGITLRDPSLAAKTEVGASAGDANISALLPSPSALQSSREKLKRQINLELFSSKFTASFDSNLEGK